MIHVIAASCNASTWQQKWACGSHQPTNWTAGYGLTAPSRGQWLLLAALILVVLVVLARRRRGASRAARRPSPARAGRR